MHSHVRNAASIPTHVVKAQDFRNRVDFDTEISNLIEHYAAELVVLAGFMKLFQPAVRSEI